MAQMTSEVSKLLHRALSLSIEEQEALADSLISSLGGKVDENLRAAWEAEIGRRVAELDSGKAKTTSWAEVRGRNLAKLPDGQPLTLSIFTTKLAPSTMQHLTGILLEVRIPR